jgi:hypothetical protein
MTSFDLEINFYVIYYCSILQELHRWSFNSAVECGIAVHYEYPEVTGSIPVGTWFFCQAVGWIFGWSGVSFGGLPRVQSVELTNWMVDASKVLK